ncbi:MAG: hypothetical protein RMJ67_03285 [Elusimicrobiota bacterium]|nr:hypothetical protein [Endomicrobiia bacterium]MCX7910186.1 hypothetical protein [Endomicrobiia bacterium]MDW8165518.1 hypothetical protein [Elusimicrobiota bacterium]
MKKLLILSLIFVGICTFIYYEYYETGKINSFLENYPDSKYAQTVEYILGMLCSVAGKYDAAIFRFKRVINIYNLEKYKPAAYYNIAKVYEEKKEMKLALNYYRLTFEQFPKTYYGDLGKKRYDYLLLLGYKEK